MSEPDKTREELLAVVRQLSKGGRGMVERATADERPGQRMIARVGPATLKPVREGGMLPKIIVVVIMSVALAAIEATRAFTIPFFILALAVVFVIEGVRVVPQQYAWVVERLGKYHETLQPGLNVIIPVVDRVAYRHSLKEVPLDVPEQVCITKDNTQLAVDGIVYYQVMDREARFLRHLRLHHGHHPARADHAAQRDRQDGARQGLSRAATRSTAQVVSVLDEAGRTWGIKVLRYEVKSLTPPEAILRAMQQQITAEREKRALIAKSEGQKQEEINLAEGSKQAAILQVRGREEPRDQQGAGRSHRDPPDRRGDRGGGAPRWPRRSNTPGGMNAANLKVAELYIGAFGNLAKTGNTLIVPTNLSDVS